MKTRTTAEIDQDINAAKLQLTKLKQERAEAVEYYEECGCEDAADIPAIVDVVEPRDAALMCVMKRACWIVAERDMYHASYLLDQFEELLNGADPTPYIEAEASEIAKRYDQFINGEATK